VSFQGNIAAQKLIDQLLLPCDQNWRGIGSIPQSGWKLRSEFSDFDAENRFEVGSIKTQESPECMAGLILQGIKKPFQCPAFGSTCTPERPLGATMVSSEGACAAYYRYSGNN